MIKKFLDVAFSGDVDLIVFGGVIVGKHRAFQNE